jgi:chromosome segregation ATPase
MCTSLKRSQSLEESVTIMSEEPEKKPVDIEGLKESLADLRFSVSEFQDSIGEYLVAVEELWSEVKSHLASVEARLAGLEVQLSNMSGDAEDWQPEKLDQMLSDLREIGGGIARMRQRFRSFTQGYRDRIN